MKLNGKSLTLIITFIAFALIYTLGSVILPFFIAALLAYLSNPLVKRLMRYKFSRLFATIIVFFCMFFSIVLFILLLIPLFHKQASALSEQLPNMIVWLQQKSLPYVNKYLTFGKFDINDIKNMIAKKLMDNAGSGAWLLHSGKALVHTILSFILIPVVTFYLLRDWEIILMNIKYSIPTQMRPSLVKLAQECDFVLSGFFRGQLLVMLFLALYYAITLSLIGLQLGVVIGLIVGITSIVPYLGLLIGIVIAILAALVQYGSLSSVIWVVAVFCVGHSIENFYLTPKLIGDRIGLHPVIVIFAILAGGSLFGFFGVLLALPIAAIVMVLLRHLHGRYSRSHFYNGA